MSSFKRKVNIVESTTPPTNQYDWWYDLNREQLKQFKGGYWMQMKNLNESSENSNYILGVSYDEPTGGYREVGNIRLVEDLDMMLKMSNLSGVRSFSFLDGPSCIKATKQFQFDDRTQLYFGQHVKTINANLKVNNGDIYFGGPLDSIHTNYKVPSFVQANSIRINTLNGVNTIDSTFLIIGDALALSAAGQLEGSPDSNDGKTKSIVLPSVKTLKSQSVSFAKYTYDENDDTRLYTLRFVIPDSIKTIEPEAFAYSSRAVSDIVYHGESTDMLIINNGIWLYCGANKTAKVQIPQGVTYIDGKLFSTCLFVETIMVPSSVTSIGKYAFSTANLKELYIANPEPPVLVDGSDLFPNSIQKIYVPSESVDKYKTATNWALWADKIVGHNFN